MTDAMRERPAPYIQNHVSWCWATAAKIVGFHFLMSTGKSIPIKPEQGIIVESMVGFRWDYVRKSCEHIFADAWQYDIVKGVQFLIHLVTNQRETLARSEHLNM